MAAAQRGFVRGRFFLTSVRSFVLGLVVRTTGMRHRVRASVCACVLDVCACACARVCVCVCGVVCCASLVMFETVRARGRCDALCARAYWYGDPLSVVAYSYRAVHVLESGRTSLELGSRCSEGSRDPAQDIRLI